MTVPVLEAIREVQLVLVAAMLVGGSMTKLARTLRTGSGDAGLGPTALFPLNLRRPVAMTVWVIEGGLGIGLAITARNLGGIATATCIRVGAVLLFVVATSALIELRTVQPDMGCGCFGDFSTAPVSGRTIARSALLAAAALSTVGLGFRIPRTGASGLELLAILCAELLVIGALSPEVGEGLIRLGYSEPCELRHVPSARTLAALRRSKQWRRYSSLIAADAPVDVWRELCWRYVVFPSSYPDRPADLVFAVFLQRRRPTVHAVLVDAGTGQPLPWPGPAGGGDSRPVVAAPLPASPLLDTPFLQAPVLEAPVLEAPVLEAPVLEAPVLEAPLLEAPLLEAPLLEAPLLEAPLLEAPLLDSSRGSLRVPAGLGVAPARAQADLPLSTDL